MNAAPQVLLIDNDRAWLETLADYLGAKGFRVRTADRPARGLALLDSDDVQAVVLDFEMPEMDGLELLRRIRQRRRQLPVLLLSGADDPSLPRRALAEGARAFLRKDLRPRVFLDRLRQFLASAVAETAPWPPSYRLDHLLPPPRPLRSA
jgi:DNA-binding response OmpR family regulator